MADEEFFKGRVQEEVGGDKDSESTHVPRIHSPRPNRADKARIVVTLHFNSDVATRRERLPAYQAHDTLHLVRQHVTDYNNGKLSLEDLVKMADSIDVEGAK